MVYLTDTGAELGQNPFTNQSRENEESRQSEINSVQQTRRLAMNKAFPVYGKVLLLLGSDQGLNPRIVCYSEHMKRPRRNYSHVKRARTRAKVLHTVKVKLASFQKLALNRKTQKYAFHRHLEPSLPAAGHAPADFEPLD